MTRPCRRNLATLSGTPTDGSPRTDAESRPPWRSASSPSAEECCLAYELLKRPADVHNENATFMPQKPPKPAAKTVNWPIFGLNAARTRYLPAKGVKPPYRLIWHYTERPLLEFPPVYAEGKLFFINNNGYAFALDADSGKVLWERRIGALNASSPAYYKHRLYIVNLVPGHVVKLNARTGKVIWKRSLPGRAESSPLVIDNTVYFGCENGELFALSTRNGHTRWSTSLAGPVKSAPAFHDGVLFVGDYGGDMNAVSAKTGKIKWQTASLGQGFGTSGEFYSTPAVAFGRVYAGNNDDRVYSFDEKTGAIAWSHSTGGYVYSGPTVAHTGTPRRRSTSAPSTATSTPSTRRTAKPGGSARPAARSLVRFPRSATSSTSPSSPTARPTAT